MGRGRRGLFALIVLGILLPGVILAVFGFRSLRQDRLLAERQTRDALQSSVEVAAREVTRELARWQEWDEPTSATLTLTPGASVLSARGLLWLPGTVSEPHLDANARRAEEAELRQRDFAKALQLYEAALREASPEARAALLLRIARTAKKAGDLERARRAWRQIVSLPTSPAAAPAWLELVESGAVPALDFYRELIARHFPLVRESYSFYSGRVRELIGEAGVAEYRELERRRTALTLASEAFLAAPRRNPTPGFIAFWEAGRAILLPEDALRARLTKAAQSGPGTAITLRARQSASMDLSASRPLDDPQLPWQLEAAPHDPAALERSLRNRETLFLGGLGLVMAVLLSGVCLTARAVRRESEFARLQSDFVATVSHEFRSPLTGIRQLAELLDSGIVKAEERRQEYFGLILKESDRLAHLVENLLDFSRLEAGRKQYSMDRIDSSAWLEGTAAAVRNSRLCAEIPAGLPAVRGDRDSLASAVANLMDNALKYSPPESSVRLAAHSGSGKLSISVSDHGPGIALEEQSRIFEKFYRSGGELSRQVKGAGIGLSLVKRIVEDHGGNVSVFSQPGEGSTFTIDLKVIGDQPS